MEVDLEIKKGRKIKVATGTQCSCSSCVFKDHKFRRCPGFLLCKYLDSLADGVYHYFVLD